MKPSKLIFLSLILCPLLCAGARAEEAPASSASKVVPEGLREIYAAVIGHPDSPLPYFQDSQGIIYDKRVSPPKPITEIQAKDLRYKLKGLWLATQGVPPTLTKKHAESVTPHLYDPDGHVSALGNDLFMKMLANRDLTPLIALQEMAVQIQKKNDSRFQARGDPHGPPPAANALDSFFDQARHLKDSNALFAEPNASIPVDLSQTLPFQLQSFKRRTSSKPAKAALESLMGGSGVPMISADMGELMREMESKKTGGADWPKALEAAIGALPMGAEILNMGVHKMWAAGYTGKNVKIALIDEDFPDRVQPLLRNVVLEKIQGQSEGVGEHATHLAGILMSVAPGAEILAYSKRLPEGLADVAQNVDLRSGDPAMASAVSFAIHRRFIAGLMEDAHRKGARIISVSMEIRGAENPEEDPILQTIDKLSRAGVAFIIGAGNSVMESHGGDRDIAYNNAAARAGNSLTAHPDVIRVGNLDSQMRAHPTSFAGDVYAPGAQILSTLPTSRAFEENLIQGLRPPFEGRYGPMTGTSMAAPFVAAVAACLLEAAPSATPAQLKEALISSAASHSQKIEFLYADPISRSAVQLQEEIRWKSVNPADALQALQKNLH
ncbi:MAG: S8 family serine peptidase [Elusimicrobia bacterium]|nr:S8 family serine peptidase [Elusimicrobiota bacterium]